MKKNIQKPISRVKFPAEHVPGVRKCRAIHGKRGKAVKVRFYEKMMKKITFIQFLDSAIFRIFSNNGIVFSKQFYIDLYNLNIFFRQNFNF